MGATIGTTNLEKSVKRSAASGYVAVKGIVATPLNGKPKMAAVDKDGTPSFAVIVDARGEKRARRVSGDKAAAEKAAMAATMKAGSATVFLAQKVGSAEGRDVFKLLGSYRRA